MRDGKEVQFSAAKYLILFAIASIIFYELLCKNARM